MTKGVSQPRSPGTSQPNALVAPRIQAPGTTNTHHTASASRNCIVSSAIITAPGRANPVAGIYTQRRLHPSTPNPSQDSRLSPSHPHDGLPPRLVANLAALGVRAMYPWQAASLAGPGMLAGTRNLVYTAPTSGGKSLVADVLMLRRVIREGRKALIVLPYVALVQEKVKWLQRVIEGVVRPAENADRHAVEEGGDGCRPIRVAPFHGGANTVAGAG